MSEKTVDLGENIIKQAIKDLEKSNPEIPYAEELVKITERDGLKHIKELIYESVVEFLDKQKRFAYIYTYDKERDKLYDINFASITLKKELYGLIDKTSLFVILNTYYFKNFSILTSEKTYNVLFAEEERLDYKNGILRTNEFDELIEETINFVRGKQIASKLKDLSYCGLRSVSFGKYGPSLSDKLGYELIEKGYTVLYDNISKIYTISY